MLDSEGVLDFHLVRGPCQLTRAWAPTPKGRDAKGRSSTTDQTSAYTRKCQLAHLPPSPLRKQPLVRVTAPPLREHPQQQVLSLQLLELCPAFALYNPPFPLSEQQWALFPSKFGTVVLLWQGGEEGRCRSRNFWNFNVVLEREEGG